MVTAFAAVGADVAPGGSLEIDYEFTNLPGSAVFSVYGYIDGNAVYHTNRAFLDNADLTRKVSTFAVTPEPATLLTAAAGAALLAGWRRR